MTNYVRAGKYNDDGAAPSFFSTQTPARLQLSDDLRTGVDPASVIIDRDHNGVLLRTKPLTDGGIPFLMPTEVSATTHINARDIAGNVCVAVIPVTVTPSQKMLAIKKARGGQWYPPGGLTDPSDRTLWDAAAREVMEETGHEIFVLDPPQVKLLYNSIFPMPKPRRQNLMAFFMVNDIHSTIDVTTPLVPDGKEVTEARWVDMVMFWGAYCADPTISMESIRHVFRMWIASLTQRNASFATAIRSEASRCVRAAFVPKMVEQHSMAPENVEILFDVCLARCVVHIKVAPARDTASTKVDLAHAMANRACQGKYDTCHHSSALCVSNDYKMLIIKDPSTEAWDLPGDRSRSFDETPATVAIRGIGNVTDHVLSASAIKKPIAIAEDHSLFIEEWIDLANPATRLSAHETAPTACWMDISVFWAACTLRHSLYTKTVRTAIKEWAYDVLNESKNIINSTYYSRMQQLAVTRAYARKVRLNEQNVHRADVELLFDVCLRIRLMNTTRGTNDLQNLTSDVMEDVGRLRNSNCLDIVDAAILRKITNSDDYDHRITTEKE